MPYGNDLNNLLSNPSSYDKVIYHLAKLTPGDNQYTRRRNLKDWFYENVRHPFLH
jgi:hypothetical protein